MSSPPPTPGQTPGEQDPNRQSPDRSGQGTPAEQPGAAPRPDAPAQPWPPGAYPEAGAYGYGPGGSAPYGRQPRNGIGTAALVLGIVAVLTGVFFIGGLFGLVAIGLGIFGIVRASQGIANNRGVAIAGLVLGVIGVLISIAILVFSVGVFSRFGGGDYVSCLKQAGSDTAAQQQCQQQLKDRVNHEEGSQS